MTKPDLEMAALALLQAPYTQGHAWAISLVCGYFDHPEKFPGIGAEVQPWGLSLRVPPTEEDGGDVTPGRLDRIRAGACRYCGGWDMGGIGVIHHAPSCTRNTCSICSRHIEIGEHRAAGVPARHLDCEIDYLEHLDEEHA